MVGRILYALPWLCCALAMTTPSATAIQPKSRTERFIEFLKDKLGDETFDRLHLALGYKTTNRISRLLNPAADNLSCFTAQEVGKLSEALSIPPQDLIHEWDLGVNVITLGEANALVRELGMKVGFSHAA